VNARSGTRVPCDLLITVVSVDSPCAFSESCHVILVNPNGCAARISRAVAVGTMVRLQGLPVPEPVIARVTACINLGKGENLWLMGLAIDEPGNVWGLDDVPADWRE